MQIHGVCVFENNTRLKSFRGCPSKTAKELAGSHNLDMSKGLIAAAMGLNTAEIISDGVGGFNLPNGRHISMDGTGGYTLPDGSHILPNGMGGFKLPNGQHILLENEDFD